MPPLVQILIWSRIPPSPVKAKSPGRIQFMQSGNRILQAVARQGQLHLCLLPQPTAPSTLLSAAALHFDPASPDRGVPERREEGWLAACAAVKLRAGLGSSTTATKISCGPSDRVICSMPLVHPEAQRGSGMGEGSSLDICMPEGCLPSHLVLSEYIGSPLSSLTLGEILGCLH